MDRIYNQKGNVVWRGSLGAASPPPSSFTTTATAVTQLSNSAANLANQVKSDKSAPNDLGKAAFKIASISGGLAGVAGGLAVAAAGTASSVILAPVGIVLGAVAGVLALVGTIFGSDEDEATLQEAAQWVAENTKIENQNYVLDQRKRALQSSIENALPYLQQFTEKNLSGLMGFGRSMGAPSATAQLISAKSSYDYLSRVRVRKIDEIATLIENFTKVADSIVNRNKYLTNMKNLQQYGSYAAGAASLTGITLGIIKIVKGDRKKGAFYAGGGLLAAAAAYYLYSQSQINTKTLATASNALQQYSSIINASNTAKYPTKEQLLKAFDTTVVDKDERAAVNQTYNPDTGQWTRNGYWLFQIINTEPIEWKQSKGSEVYYNISKLYLSKMGLNGLSSKLLK